MEVKETKQSFVVNAHLRVSESTTLFLKLISKTQQSDKSNDQMLEMSITV